METQGYQIETYSYKIFFLQKRNIIFGCKVLYLILFWFEVCCECLQYVEIMQSIHYVPLFLCSSVPLIPGKNVKTQSICFFKFCELNINNELQILTDIHNWDMQSIFTDKEYRSRISIPAGVKQQLNLFLTKFTFVFSKMYTCKKFDSKNQLYSFDKKIVQ